MNEIESIIIEEIKKKGRISYKEFIEISLYYPGLGYYHRFSPGKGGDFITSPTASPLFSYVLSNFLIDISHLFKEKFQILELGGGEGFLAKDILSLLEGKKHPLFENMRYIIFELFKRRIPYDKIEFIDSLEEIDEFSGIIISNEFFDSLPFRIVEKSEGEIKELYISYKNGFMEERGEISDEALQFIENFPLELEAGERAELRTEDYKFFKKISGILKEGAILTIDYGSERKKKDTYRSYKNHRVYMDILGDPGMRDITADVDFDLLRKAGEEEGFEKVFLMTQEEFLLKYGIFEIIEELGKEDFLLNQAKFLLSPEFMGGRFKVLFQKRSKYPT
ncbi:MAG: class I SAM-dependent methyltransferase [Candidatus Aminicenantia bacterium]